MPFFITTIHVLTEADNINEARRKVDAYTEEAAQEHDCLTDVAWLPHLPCGSGRAGLVLVPKFDPETEDLHKANARARGDSDA